MVWDAPARGAAESADTEMQDGAPDCSVSPPDDYRKANGDKIAGEPIQKSGMRITPTHIFEPPCVAAGHIVLIQGDEKPWRVVEAFYSRLVLRQERIFAGEKQVFETKRTPEQITAIVRDREAVRLP